MAARRFRTHLIGALAVAALGTAMMSADLPKSHADAVAYLVNVTVRPGYNFANADAALGYGDGICRKLAEGRTYGEIMADVRTDFGTADDYHASYLITQAANELCPAMIWQLRQSAAGYRSPAG
jgi:hypothetical protein